MGLFANSSSPLDSHIERATSDKNTTEDWSIILDVCDRVKEYSDGPKDCIKALTKKLNNENPRVALQAIILLDACISNCGRAFLLEVASREFELELRRFITSHRTHSKVSEKLRRSLKTWAEGEFKTERQLSLIPALYRKLQQEGYDFSATSDSEPAKKKVEYSNDPNVVNNKQEEDDIAQAIQLSLQTAALKGHGGGSGGGGGGARSLYPSDLSSDMQQSLVLSDTKGPATSNTNGTSGSSAEGIKKARALYNFEAAEDNELTFQAGELIVVIDNSDPNWWKGSNHRGEGLFPANFVTLDIHGETDGHSNRTEKRVSFSECVKVTEVEGGGDDDEYGAEAVSGAVSAVEVTGEVDEEKMDQLFHLLHEADPTGERPDDPQLPLLEEQVAAMAPTIDADLEQIDRRHNELTRLSADLMAGLDLYHQLMREMPVSSVGYYPVPYGGLPPIDPVTGQPLHQQMSIYPPYGSMPPMMAGGPPMGPYPPMSMAPHPGMGGPPSFAPVIANGTGPSPPTSLYPGQPPLQPPVSSQEYLSNGVTCSPATVNPSTTYAHYPPSTSDPGQHLPYLPTLYSASSVVSAPHYHYSSPLPPQQPPTSAPPPAALHEPLL